MDSTSQNPTKTFIVSLFLLSHSIFSLSHPLHSQPLFSQTSPPPPISQLTPSNFNNHTKPALQPILLGVLLGSLIGFILSLLFLSLIRIAFLYTHLTPLLKGPVVFTPQINPKSLQLALLGQNQSTQLTQIPNSAPNCKYFKLQLESSLSIAIKLVSHKPSSNSEKRKIQQKLEYLSQIKHRNVLALRAYLFEKEKLFLAYDFVNGGASLEDLMKRVRTGQIGLNWEIRSKIALGVSKGLRYLHFECNPKLMHWNLKPSNIILDEMFEPKLGDCCLIRVLSENRNSGFNNLGHFGHFLAPECNQNSRYTDKSDIYSFGLILSILLTGRDPTDQFSTRESSRCNLTNWLRQKQHNGEAKEALDASILGDEGEEMEMVMAVRVALVCLSDLPTDRPSSDELVSMLSQLHSF
ncbi:hypothetical protein LUZ60_002037 [Juncus effusus]|nr:hypothetical protein LUZ60_002037 [Juncus effusus]